MTDAIRALIVEDSKDDTLLMARELTKQGFEVNWERVQTADEMNRALEEQLFDIVLADYMMPKFNALEALQLFQQSGRDIPFIVISGTVGENVAVETMRAGAHDYLMKGNLVRLGEGRDSVAYVVQLCPPRTEFETRLDWVHIRTGAFRKPGRDSRQNLHRVGALGIGAAGSWIGTGPRLEPASLHRSS